ncbi:MAG: UDP-glucose 4-epimerase GalE, partial [bacterium]|nr:UDP-glucose 4-epimerase GalE [bacterium]
IEPGQIKTYNLGNGEGFSVREVIETCREVTGHEIPAEITPRRPGDPPRLVASSQKAISELGWKPKFPELKTIVSDAWGWHEKHPNGYDD